MSPPISFCHVTPTWHHNVMKLFFLFTFLAIAIACTPNKSAGSASVQNNAATTQGSPQKESALTPDKQKCTLTVASVPALNGLKPGMSIDEVLAIFPGSKADAEVRSQLSRPVGRFGSLTFEIKPAKYKLQKKFERVSRMVFDVLDGRVARFTLHYDGPEYGQVDKFVSKFVESTSLPTADQWEASDPQRKTLKCTDAEISVFAGGPGGKLNHILVRHPEADKKLRDPRSIN